MRRGTIFIIFLLSIFANSPDALSDRLAVLPCDIGARVEASVKEAKILIHDTLINQARKFTSMTIITRENVWTILKDRGIDPEKCGEGKCAVDNGRILQADKIITCSISKPGATYYIFLNYYETASAKLIDSKRKEVRGGVDDVIKALEALAEELFRGEKIGEGDAQLYIVTKTPEVEFEIDEGEISGKVVDKKIVYLSPGSHRIKFSKRGYQSLKEEFFAEAARVKTIEVELFPEVREVKKEQGSGMLDIVTEPDGAEIYLDGEKVKNPDGSSMLTPNTLVDVPAGEHIVLIKKPLYKSVTKRVYISPEGKEELKVKLEENYGSLHVKTEPEGGFIYLDGKNMGVSPLIMDRLPAKAYILEVKLPNYHDYKETIYVKPKEKTLKEVKLQPAFGSLKVTGVKGAKVFLDAQEIGEVPFFQKIVSPGWHWLEVRHPLYKPMRQRVEVEEGKTKVVSAQLEPYFGYLTVESNVKDAPIKIDGETVGYGSIKEYVLRAGEHRLTVGDPEKYRVWDQRIAIGVLEKKRVIANPRPRLGTLLLASVPRGADVYVDGKKMGKTPVVLKLLKGEHKIVLKKVGYSSVEKRVNIKEGEAVSLKLRIPKYKPDPFYDRIFYKESLKNYLYIFTNFHNSEAYKTALFNLAQINYDIENYQESISYLSLYIKKFPEDEENVKKFYLYLAECFDKIGRPEDAYKVYLEYIKNNPDDYGNVIKIYYWIANYEKIHKTNDLAKTYKALLRIYNKLSDSEKEKFAYIAAEAKFNLVNMLYEEYKRIKLELPKKMMIKLLEKKAKLLKRLVQELSEISKIGDCNWTVASLYMIAKAYKDFADALYNAPVPPQLTNEERDIYLQELQMQAFPTEQRAIEAAKRAIKYADTVGIENEWVYKAKLLLRELKPGYEFKKSDDKVVRALRDDIYYTYDDIGGRDNKF